MQEPGLKSIACEFLCMCVCSDHGTRAGMQMRIAGQPARGIFWRMWGHVHYFHCTTCMAWFPFHELRRCWKYENSPVFVYCLFVYLFLAYFLFASAISSVVVSYLLFFVCFHNIIIVSFLLTCMFAACFYLLLPYLLQCWHLFDSLTHLKSDVSRLAVAKCRCVPCG